MSLSLTKEQTRAGFLSSEYAKAKRNFLQAIEDRELNRVLVPSELVFYAGRESHTTAQRASDVLIDSATHTYKAQDELAQLLVDGSKPCPLFALFDELREFIADQEDVVDGSYGIPQANRAMSLGQQLDEALAKYRKQEVHTRCALVVSMAAERFADDEVTRAEADL